MLATELLASLVAERRNLLADRMTDCSLNEAFKSTANCRFQDSRLIIDLTAWDHQFGLDIAVLDGKSGHELWRANGHCDSERAFRNRFSQFVSWLEKFLSEPQ